MQTKDEKPRLERYIRKTEARNKELEQSNRVLRRRTAVLEDNATPRTVNEHTHSVKNGCDTGLNNDVD